MSSKAHSLDLICPCVQTGESLKRQLSDLFYNVRPDAWHHHEANNCLLVAFYRQREAHKNFKILKLLMHSSRQSAGVETDTDLPTDAEIIFGNCNCQKMFCDREQCRRGWDRSRIDWLWELEKRQQQLQQTWEEQGVCREFPKEPPTAPPIKLQKPVKLKPKKTGCFGWLRHSCGYVSSTESLDVPFSKNSINL